MEGCYWGGPYEVWLFDISDPMAPRVLWKGIGDFGGWESPDSARVVGLLHDVVSLPGHPLHGKSESYCTIDDLHEVEREARARGLDLDVDEDCAKVWVETEDKVVIVNLPADANQKEGE